MTQVDHVRAVGPFHLARPLEPSDFGARWLARHIEQQTDWTLHEFGPVLEKSERVMVLSWLECAESWDQAHLPAIRRIDNPYSSAIWAAEPFFGSEDGLLTLERLIGLKGGRMSPHEVERAMAHVFDAMRYAHARGVCHGPATADELLIDRHGSVTVDLFGLKRRMAGLVEMDEEIVRDEVRSVAMIGYRALTGLPAEEPRIRASRLVKRLDRVWDEWFDSALDPALGFASADEAIAALPSQSGVVESVVRSGAARAMLDRLKTAVTSVPRPEAR
jgi:serine/threonine protein kinase